MPNGTGKHSNNNSNGSLATANGSVAANGSATTNGSVAVNGSATTNGSVAANGSAATNGSVAANKSIVNGSIANGSIVKESATNENSKDGCCIKSNASSTQVLKVQGLSSRIYCLKRL